MRRRKCSKCGEDLGWTESDPCDKCFDEEELELDEHESRESTVSDPQKSERE